MSDADEIERRGGQGARTILSAQALDVNFTNAYVMDEKMADALVKQAEANRDAAKHTHAVPAEQQTKREYAKSLTTIVVVLGGIGAICWQPSVAWPIVVLVGAVYGTLNLPKVIDSIKGLGGS